MELEIYRPLHGAKKQMVIRFLAESGLEFDENAAITVCLYEDGAMAATGSLDGNVLKCLAVRPDYQGEGLSATLVTALWKEASQQGKTHLFLYTKPENLSLFQGVAFYPVASTSDALLMENRRNGLRDFLCALPQPAPGSCVGAVVANCNPFTLGHRYLIETAARACDRLYVFILSEERSMFPAQDRLWLAKEACRDLPNVSVHPTDGYLITAATFPSYFIKEKKRVDQIHCQLDLAVFAQRFAPALNIARRFVGSEPLCPVTCAYNQAMKNYLPAHGVEVVEIRRQEIGGAPVSASRVRQLFLADRLEELKSLVPPVTFEYLAGMAKKP